MVFRKAAGWNSLRNGVWLPYETTTQANITVSEPPASTLFDFQILDTSGSTSFTSVPNLRVYLSGDVNDPANWYPVGSVPGHTLTLSRGADGKSLVISGWTGGVAPAGVRIHFEQRLPEEPNNAYGAEAGLFARRIGDTGPINPRLPGMSISPTIWNAPVGVT